MEMTVVAALLDLPLAAIALVQTIAGTLALVLHLVALIVRVDDAVHRKRACEILLGELHVLATLANFAREPILAHVVHTVASDFSIVFNMEIELRHSVI